MQESGVIEKAALVYGQMDEPPGVRLRVALSRAHGRRVLPRREEPGRAALRRQHLPLRAGRLRGVDAARPHAFGGGLPADARRRDGRAAGAHHLDQGSLDHVAAGRVRARRRLHRPRAVHHVHPPRRHHRALPPDRGARHLPGGRPAGVDVEHPRARDRRASATTTCARRTQEMLQRYKELQDIIAILGLDELSEEDRVTVVPGPQDPAVPVAAVLRGRGVHRPARHLRAGRGDGRVRSRRSSTASSTTCPSRRSSTSAASSRCSPRPRRCRRAD